MYEFLYLCKVAAMRLPVRAYRALQLSQISVISDLSLWNRIFDVVSSVATIYNLNLLTHWRRLVAKSILITEIWDNCDNWGACGGHWKKPHPAKKKHHLTSWLSMQKSFFSKPDGKTAQIAPRNLAPPRIVLTFALSRPRHSETLTINYQPLPPWARKRPGNSSFRLCWALSRPSPPPSACLAAWADALPATDDFRRGFHGFLM